MGDEYCPFQETCKYAKDFLLTKSLSVRKSDENFLIKDLSEVDKFRVIAYRCKAVESKPIEGSRCSYVNHLNRTLRILDNLLKIEC